MHSTVLLVEDNAGDARLVREALDAAGDRHQHRFSVRHVQRLADAISMLASNVDIVLLDLSLPDSQGLKGFTQIRTASPSTPIVVLTGLRDESVAIDSLRLGAQDYIFKSDISAERVGQSLRFALARQHAAVTAAVAAARTSRANADSQARQTRVREVESPDGRQWVVCEQIAVGGNRVLVATCDGVRRTVRTFPSAWVDLPDFDVFGLFDGPIGI